MTEEGSTHSPKEMQLGGGYCNLFSQKSKIFASFPKGEALKRSRASALNPIFLQQYGITERDMKHLFIINPAAGSRDRTGEYTAQIRRLCEGLDFEIRVSEGPGDCCRFAREAAQTEEEVRIYACGGDGTLNEVAAGAAGYPNAAVTAYSGGSGNDFVKLFSDPGAFSDLSRLLEAEEVTFDMISCNGDLALNICSVGLDARIGTDVARYKRLPFLHGFNAYALSTLVNVFRGISQHYIVEINGECIDAEQTFVCVCNGRWYGGGFNPVPEADPTDGKLDVLLVKKVTLLQVAQIIGKYKDGKYRELPEFVRHFTTDSVRVICDGPSAVNLDGELRMSQTVDMSVAEQKVRFFYPRGLTWQAEVPADAKASLV